MLPTAALLQPYLKNVRMSSDAAPARGREGFYNSLIRVSIEQSCSAVHLISSHPCHGCMSPPNLDKPNRIHPMYIVYGDISRIMIILGFSKTDARADTYLYHNGFEREWGPGSIFFLMKHAQSFVGNQ